MEGNRLIGVAIGVLAAIACVTSFWVGLGVGSTENQPANNAILPVENNIDLPELPTDDSVYTLVIYDGRPEVEILTKHEHINPLSENTMLITNKSLDEVNQEICDSMDYIEVN